MKKIAKGLVVILIVAALTLSLVPAISSAASTTSPEKTNDDSVKIESKEKTVKFQIKWNANGGKIGSKKTISTSVKKGSKIGKLAKTPKRSGYSFKGRYTKKSGGTKITKNTKPKKSVTYYAKWAKKGSTGKPRVLTAEEKKHIGEWENSWDGSSIYKFYDNGNYVHASDTSIGSSSKQWEFAGKYSLKNGILTLQYQYREKYGGHIGGVWAPWSAWETSKMNIEFATENGKQYFKESGRSVSYVKQ